MNTRTKRISAGVASLIAGTLLLATPTAAGADSPQQTDICPAIDTQPLCDIGPAEGPSNSGGSTVATLAADADGRVAYVGYSQRPWLVIVASPF